MLAKGFSVPELAHPALPPVAAWFPLPPGWWVLGGLFLLALIAGCLVMLARHRRNRWRREARQALALRESDAWIHIIKRVLLVHHSRQQVAQWQTPQQLLKQLPLDDDLRALLCQKYCQSDNAIDSQSNQRIARQLRAWLESLPHV